MKLSVAIPAYNAEKTLKRTVESVLAQTHRDLEVLIVNNGSVDGTHDVAVQLAASDLRVKVFDVYPNVYGYGARLHAWRQATGDYITSVDADDTLSPVMYESMLKVAADKDLDVVECGYDTCEDGTPTKSLDLVEVSVGREAVLERYVRPVLVDVGVSAYIWNKIYRNQYDFSQWEQGAFGNQEDLIHNLQLFRPVKSYGYMPAELYHYLPTPGSVTRKFSMALVERFTFSAEVKRRLVGAFGVDAADPILDRWVLNELKNSVIMASMAGNLKNKERPEMVRQIGELPIVRESLRRYGPRSLPALVFIACRIVPPSVIVNGIRFLKKIH